MALIKQLLLIPILISAAVGMETVASLNELAKAAAGNSREIRMQPGVYRMSDYLTDEVLAEIARSVKGRQGRPPVPMFVFRGDNNRIDLSGVTVEIDTTLYRKLPQGGYTRCLIVAGKGNTLDGLTIRNTGPNRGSGGNILSVEGDDNTLENVTLHVRGSFPWGYGDLLGKGGPNLVGLEKQSGIQVIGSRSVLKRCKVFSRAFGHCFYVQGGDESRLEDCYAEGSVRNTTEMLGDTEGPAIEKGFRSVYENRDGRFVITPGYTKSLSEDGFRTYGNAGSVTLINCTAVNTRAGFEIGARDDAEKKTLVENCVARGCERAYLIGSNTIVRRSRGDVKHGPLLYLRGGLNSDVELELADDLPISTVHAIATIAGVGHRVKLIGNAGGNGFPKLPVMLGFGMPEHAEMASPIRPAKADKILLISELSGVPVLESSEVDECRVEAAGPVVSDEELRKVHGKW